MLFTSYSSMRSAVECRSFLRNGLRLLVQGEADGISSFHRFVTTPSVLFGTDSFWEGVDVRAVSVARCDRQASVQSPY